MHRHQVTTRPDSQMLVTSPRCSLNCNGLSMHLPPLGERSDYGSNYISPPMSASYSTSRFDDQIPGHSTTSHRSVPKSSYHSSSSKKSSAHPGSVNGSKTLAKEVRNEYRSTNGAGTSGLSSGSRSTSANGAADWADSFSPTVQDSPEGQLIPGPPGIARRAKAHVPSACVNCKKKHLACETKRPCNRCVQNGKEVSPGNTSLVCFSSLS